MDRREQGNNRIDEIIEWHTTEIDTITDRIVHSRAEIRDRIKGKVTYIWERRAEYPPCSNMQWYFDGCMHSLLMILGWLGDDDTKK